LPFLTDPARCVCISRHPYAKETRKMGNSPCASAVAEPPETRTSDRGTPFDAETLRDFLRAALRHAAVSDAVAQLGFESVAAGRTTPSQLSAELRPLLEEALATATDADFLTIACDVIADVADALGVRPLLIDPSDEQMAADMQRTIYEGNQTPEELRTRARELRDKAALSDLPGVREAALAMAERKELVAALREDLSGPTEAREIELDVLAGAAARHAGPA
jgi:hypothetical protein